MDSKVYELPKYEIALKVGKADKNGRRPIYGELKVRATSKDELKNALNYAMEQLAHNLN